jgi:hypothetical protein
MMFSISRDPVIIWLLRAAVRPSTSSLVFDAIVVDHEGTNGEEAAQYHNDTEHLHMYWIVA